MKAKTPAAAQELAQNLRTDWQHWLRLEDSNLLLAMAAPETQTTQGTNVEVRFDVPENSARLVLQRIAKTDTPPQVTAR